MCSWVLKLWFYEQARVEYYNRTYNRIVFDIVNFQKACVRHGTLIWFFEKTTYITYWQTAIRNIVKIVLFSKKKMIFIAHYIWQIKRDMRLKKSTLILFINKTIEEVIYFSNFIILFLFYKFFIDLISKCIPGTDL